MLALQERLLSKLQLYLILPHPESSVIQLLLGLVKPAVRSCVLQLLLTMGEVCLHPPPTPPHLPQQGLCTLTFDHLERERWRLLLFKAWMLIQPWELICPLPSVALIFFSLLYSSPYFKPFIYPWRKKTIGK